MNRPRAAAAAVVACLVAAASLALAQQPPRAPTPNPRPTTPVPATAAPLAPNGASPLALDAGYTSTDAGVVVVQKYDGGQTFKFGEVDIEGRLKSPTLVYFLRRVRAEFAAGDLGHRSFLRELSQTRNGQSFQ
jgi:hypothetical protein